HGPLLCVAQEFGADREAGIGRKPREVARIVERPWFGPDGRAADVKGRVCAVERAEEAVLDAGAVDVTAGDDATIVDAEHDGRPRAVRRRDGDDRVRIGL